ncbi:MAG: aconitate hydratase AcnA [Rhizobiaceae bacterium]
MSQRFPDETSFLRSLETEAGRFACYSVAAVAEAGLPSVARMPRCYKVLLENLLRNERSDGVGRAMIEDFVAHVAVAGKTTGEIALFPTRILLNDSAGIPLMADLTSMRSAAARRGIDPRRINPVIHCDLVIDHSVMVDRHADDAAFAANLDLEYERNAERYHFIRWAQNAYSNFRVVPPGKGICHQINLEYLTRGIVAERREGIDIAFPELLLGTDSHTPMVNALGVVGWGVGGIEAGAAMLGQPVSMAIPKVVGCRLTGRLGVGVTAADLVLTATERLRAHGVVGAFVEFFGPGLGSLTVADRATLSNMAPEYGATIGFFPYDDRTLAYFEQTARGGSHLDLVRRYAIAQGLWHEPDGEQPDYSETVTIDLAAVEPSLAGPKRPQDRIALANAKRHFEEQIAPSLPRLSPVVTSDSEGLDHGDVLIASITSCTNTSNPTAMLGAAILAKKAVQRGLTVKPWVKTSLAPGSRVVAAYLARGGFQPYLDRLGFNVVGFGCMTCMGNSGPLDPAVSQSVRDRSVHAASVLSGNRNFEGRVHPDCRLNYLCSPALVIAYALAGSMRIDLLEESLGEDRMGQPVRLAELWPSDEDIAAAQSAITSGLYAELYKDIFAGDERWNALDAPMGETFPWSKDSLYLREPPFFADVEPGEKADFSWRGARALAMFGDSLTTDHISPVGRIGAASAAGKYLQDRGVAPIDFNSFAARRVNHDVMIRGAFANPRIRNEMAGGEEGGVTRHEPSGRIMPIHEAADLYRRNATPLIVVAGKEYGTGSSRDWAAKGPFLLGVRAVIAESFERIHRSNLVGMGILPLQFVDGVNRHSLGLDGSETFDLVFSRQTLRPMGIQEVSVKRSSGELLKFPVRCRVDTAKEVDSIFAGGILKLYLDRT